jgi:hypothetical protein
VTVVKQPDARAPRVGVRVSQEPREAMAAAKRRGRRRDGGPSQLRGVAKSEQYELAGECLVQRRAELADVCCDSGRRLAICRDLEPDATPRPPASYNAAPKGRGRHAAMVGPRPHAGGPVDAPSVSVVVATVRGWPEVRPALSPIGEQAVEHAAEVVVLDGSGKPAPSRADRFDGLRWVSRPGESVFQLRPLGYHEARGELVLVTEDHCTPAPGWLDGHVRAHREHPEAAVVTGAVENGTGDRALEWAAFYMTHGQILPPIEQTELSAMPGAANLSFKRDALQRISHYGEHGALELLDAAPLTAGGRTIVADDRIRVHHHHSMTLPQESTIEFHNGRTIGGLRRERMERRDWIRLASLGLLPAFRAARTVKRVFSKDTSRATVVASAPLILWLQYCHALGELVGYAAGPGDSPRQLF